MAEEERRIMHLELRELEDKYVEMAKQMGVSFLVDQLLTNNAEVMIVPLPPKFKVP